MGRAKRTVSSRRCRAQRSERLVYGELYRELASSRDIEEVSVSRRLVEEAMEPPLIYDRR